MPPPATPIPRGKPGGLAGKKIGGVKAPVLLVGLALAIGIGLYIRSRSAQAGTATAAPAAADTGAGSGGASGSATDPGSGLADAIWGLTGVLGSGSFAPASSGEASTQADTSTTTAPTAQDLSAYQNLDLAHNYPNLSPSQQQALFPLGPPVVGPGPNGSGIVGPASAPATASSSASGITIPTLHLPAVTPAAPTSTATKVQPAAGAVSVKTLASGAKLYTYASGRQEEQAPGKSAYVVKAGKK